MMKYFHHRLNVRDQKISRNRFEEALEFIVFKLKIETPLDFLGK